MPLTSQQEKKIILADLLENASATAYGIDGLGFSRLEKMLAAISRAVTLENDQGIDTFTFEILEAVEKLRQHNRTTS